MTEHVDRDSLLSGIPIGQRFEQRLDRAHAEPVQRLARRGRRLTGAARLLDPTHRQAVVELDEETTKDRSARVSEGERKKIALELLERVRAEVDLYRRSSGPGDQIVVGRESKHASIQPVGFGVLTARQMKISPRSK